MNTIKDLEKKINSELVSKIKFSEIKHNQLYLGINFFSKVLKGEAINDEIVVNNNKNFI